MTSPDSPLTPSFWNESYQRGETAWELYSPTPVLRRLLFNRVFTPGKIIVLGAGRGYDAREFARHGFAVTAVDFAAEAVREMQSLAEPDAPVEILQADIFDLPPALDATFDYALEYVCYCAIEPARRGEYANTVARLLRPGGLFIDLAFPLEERSGGPPFGVSVDELLTLFTARGFKLLHRELPVDSVKPRQGREELLIFQKIGKWRQTADDRRPSSIVCRPSSKKGKPHAPHRIPSLRPPLPRSADRGQTNLLRQQPQRASQPVRDEQRRQRAGAAAPAEHRLAESETH